MGCMQSKPSPDNDTSEKSATIIEDAGPYNSWRSLGAREDAKRAKKLQRLKSSALSKTSSHGGSRYI